MSLPASDFEALFARMVGGQPERFFREVWRKKPLFVPGGLTELAGLYSPEQFIDDAGKISPYLGQAMRAGKRERVRLTTPQECRKWFLEHGMIVFNLAGVGRPELFPAPLKRLMDVYEGLQDYLDILDSVREFSPCSFFFGETGATIGGHRDYGDGFSVILSGRRRWRVEKSVRLRRAFQTLGKRDVDVPFEGTPAEFEAGPGDVVYFPAYALHQVTVLERSLSVTFGAHAERDVDWLRTLVNSSLDEIGRTQRAPLSKYPRALAGLHEASARERAKKVRSLLDRVYRKLTGKR